MRLTLLLLTTVPLLPADSLTPMLVRGRKVSLTRLSANIVDKKAAVFFLPGDGGWRGAAVSMGRVIAGWGYDVFGLDTRNYLETFSENGAKLEPERMAADVRYLCEQISGSSQRKVVLVGWSQGATMSIMAVSGLKTQAAIKGVVTLGLPESGVLGWDWKATLAIAAGRTPAQPVFPVRPWLPGTSPFPIWMIHGTEDEYTAPEVARALFQSTSEPKSLQEIRGANHRFDGHLDELYRSLQQGLDWVLSI